jgi:SAM-dependent methyltransferase
LALPENIVVHNIAKGIPCDSNSVDAVYHSHMLEHLDRCYVDNFLSEVNRVLKPGGIHRIVVPDFEYLCKKYVEHLNLCNHLKDEISMHDSYIGQIIEQCVRKESYGSSQQPFIRRWFENIILGDARARGETHQWMYDRVNLYYLLSLNGFHDIKIKNYDTSEIYDWNNYRLDITEDGKQYKPGSLYIEAKK